LGTPGVVHPRGLRVFPAAVASPRAGARATDLAKPRQGKLDGVGRNADAPGASKPRWRGGTPA